MAEYRHLAEPNPQWVEFPNNLPEGTRRVPMTRARDPIRPQPGLDIHELAVPVRNGTTVCVRTYRASGSRVEKLPLFLYMHGGGFVTGGLETDDDTCRALAAKLDVLVVSVEYRLAPENLFPMGFEDCQDVVRWVASTEGQQQLATDLSKGFVVGGTSAGGNFTAGLAHLAKEEGLSPPITGLVFLASSFCHPDVRPEQYKDRILSVDEINDAPGLTRKSIDYFSNIYKAPPEDKRYSPLLFPSRVGIARKAYFAICGWDPRRDEALLYDRLLQEAGLSTRVDVYPGLPHGFWTTCPDLPVSRDWLERFVDGMRWMLE